MVVRTYQPGPWNSAECNNLIRNICIPLTTSHRLKTYDNDTCILLAGKSLSIITGSTVILNLTFSNAQDRNSSHTCLLTPQYISNIEYLLLLSLQSTFLLWSLTTTALVPRSLFPQELLSISSSHLCALGAGMHAAYPWEEAASLGCCRWLSTWLFQGVVYQYHNRIKPDCADFLVISSLFE